MIIFTHRKRFDDVASCVYELLVHVLDEVRVIHDHFRYVRSSFQVTTTVELEHVTLRTDDGFARTQTIKKTYKNKVAIISKNMEKDIN